jgi:hypothetical protein
MPSYWMMLRLEKRIYSYIRLIDGTEDWDVDFGISA